MHTQLSKQYGIGMIEVLVTIAITTIGILGLSAMQMQSIRSVSDSGNRTHAIWVANDLINRIRANKVAFNSYLTDEMKCQKDDGSSAIPQLKMCASHSKDGSVAPPANNCSNEDLALYDQWEALCGLESLTGADTFTSSASFISDPGLTIEDEGDGNMMLTISWSSRTAGKSADGNRDIYYLESGQLAETAREDYSVVFRP